MQILNSVCIVCISKIEKFVEKMDLDTFFTDPVKKEADSRPKPASLSCDSDGETIENTEKEIKVEEFDLETDDNSDSMSPMQIDNTSRNDVTDESNTQTRFTQHGDSQTRYFPHPANTQQIRIRKDKLDGGDEPCRKRPRNAPLIGLPQDAM